ncbi:ABC transporter substrate-binding protein [Tepidibacillus sp. HK-1]|uniref:ABC transporter substrate-binding protein n=1 Tax=Tepidibacillus sp. HK-1 TaxID=1883407 RepID=UPI000853A98D|nr:ABC transporter substrate-binding protein [Tepidibacillus sp. HK-1]GBF10448.1 sn-glycerol-3-phosphate-binding periplasmic protein UgpB precursor [Tepidibacillus sp. HK-1]
MKKFVIIMLILALMVSVFGCTNTAKVGKDARTTNDGKTKVVFWHSMGGLPGETLQRLVDQYNKQQDKVFVEAIFQGSYEEALTKLKTVGGTAEAPTLMQVYEIGTKYMSESGFIQPIQDLIDKDKYDLSQLEENILGYYQIDGKLYSMPFNTSNAIMFYNKDKFREANLDPENPPQTFSEIKEAAKKLTNKSKDEYGFAILIYGWFIEQLMANQGALYIDANNGRGGEPTKSLLNSPEGLRIYEWLDEMNKEGILGNYGRNWDDIRAAFQAGKVAMYLDSTANTAAAVKNSSFEVGTAFLPSPDGVSPNGVIVGGGSIWMMNSVAEAEKDAAWDFLKFLAQPSTQADWAATTGYFPITKAAYEEKVLKDTYEKYPQFLTAVKQLQNTKLTSATKGALMGVFPEARLEVETSIEKLYQGEAPQKVLDDVTNKINKLLDDYKRVNKK